MFPHFFYFSTHSNNPVWIVFLTLKRPHDHKQKSPINGLTDTSISLFTGGYPYGPLPKLMRLWGFFLLVNWYVIPFNSQGKTKIKISARVSSPWSLSLVPRKDRKIKYHLAFFTVQLSHPYMTTGKIIALAIQLCQQIGVSAF